MRYYLSFLILVVAIALYYKFIIITKESPIEYDIVIVGSGLAGLSAAIEAYNNNQNLSILLIEKESYLGGNSMKATSGINLLYTKIQQEQGISDSIENFISDTVISSKNLSIPELVEELAFGAVKSLEFLEKYGVDLNVVSILGGHSVPRTHRPKDKPVGATITSLLRAFILANTTIKVQVNTTACEILTKEDNRKIRGLMISSSQECKIQNEIKTNAIILTSGGYGHDFANDSLIKEFAPELMNFPTTNGPQAQGKGVKIARKIGAALIHMEHIQLHPTAFIDPFDRFAKKKILAPELMRGVGGILLNEEGKRFCDELGPRDYVTEKIRNYGIKVGKQIEAFLVISEDAREVYGKNFDFYVSKGFLKYYAEWEDFCDEAELDKSEIQNTLIEYEQAQQKGEDQFGKKHFPSHFSFDKGIYAGRITPAIHYTMGGLKINKETCVLSDKGEIIQGLFAAGETTGGVHGGNRLGANSLLECVVFGRVAGKNACSQIS